MICVPTLWLISWPSTMLAAGLMSFLPEPSASTFKMKSFGFASTTGWVSLCLQRRNVALFSRLPLTYTLGDHQVGYGSNRDRIHWHDSIQKCIVLDNPIRYFSTWKEVPPLIPQTSSHPEDIFILYTGEEATSKQPRMWVISPLQNLTLTSTATTPGYDL